MPVYSINNLMEQVTAAAFPQLMKEITQFRQEQNNSKKDAGFINEDDVKLLAVRQLTHKEILFLREAYNQSKQQTQVL